MDQDQDQRERLCEEFDLWLRTRFTESIWVRGHRFERTPTGDILVGDALFSEEEAKQLFRMLTSRNPITRLNATLIIWDRNGVLVKLLLAAAFLLLVLVYAWVKR